MIDQDIYLSLKDYTLTTNLKGKEKADFEKSMNELAQYKGKTIKIPLSKSGINTTSLNQAEMISQIKKTLDILDTKSLFTPYKKINDISTLTLKNETIQSIGSVYGQKIKVSDITKVKKEMRKVPLLHTTADGRKTLFIRINEADAIGVASLTKKDIGYSFLVDMKNPKKSTESVHILMEPGLVEAKILAPQVNMDLSYKNKNLVFTGEAYMQNLKIE